MKVVASIVSSLCLLMVAPSSYARHAAILVDAENGTVLHEVEATQAWFPASLTKLMTLYITFDALSNGQIALNDLIYTSAHAASQPNSRLGLHTSERLTVQEAILALILRSANDASVALAEHIAVTESNFASRMTAKAHALGMYNSYFMNATGLPNEWQVTTARDMALLAWKVQHTFPEYYPFFAEKSFIFKGREMFGINKFTANYEGAEGMKTGFTCGSGYNLISTAHQNGKHLIGVILGGRTSNERYHLMMNNMDNGFAGNYNAVANLFNMPTQSSGIPPHQLNCDGGTGADFVPTHHHRHSSRKSLHNKRRHR